ncbi:hypothetical protein CSQ85_03980 [Bifidobacterium rousetti]|uniref:DUF3791 domain-containing protein n=1 Tax=Bifidobacterium rousetti TaxID=2045439 RepID=UPI000D140672|nr:DUF3791 domain-containing protein [Bifidobacterium rousetti]KAA8819857.1 hypothetical protein CSQ85_03980 [Bifidobacterium rousetti]PST49657.1 hypothetical protein COO72_02050 [Bifidobacterium callitrichos]
MTTLERQQVDFSVFLIHQLARKWRKSSPEVYAILDRTDALNRYIFPAYDVLHTLGSDYLTDDLTEYVRAKGVDV